MGNSYIRSFWALAALGGYFLIRKYIRGKNEPKTSKESTFISPSIPVKLELQTLHMFVEITDSLYTIINRIHLIENPIFDTAIDFKKTGRARLLHYCEPDYINESFINKWWQNIHFRNRKETIISALSAYIERQYSVSIHILLPQIEQIIIEWITIEFFKDDIIESVFKSIFTKFQNLRSELNETNIYSSGLLFLFADLIYHIISYK